MYQKSLPPETGARFLREGLSGLQQTPPDGRLAYVCLSLCGRGLRQLMLLCDVKKLLSIDISDNKLTSLYPVRLAANLVYLNASNNQIRSAAELSANAKLEHVDLRRNLITSLGDWQFNVRLRVLRLGGNKLDSLKYGNLTRNSLLRELDISNNAIESLEQLPYLKCLDTLDISSNSLKSLDGIQQAPLLVVLHAQFAAAEAFGSLEYAQRRVWESLIPDEPFADRRLLKLCSKKQSMSCPKKTAEGTF
ncbi:hypothetical protein, conserved [Eimeria tenella]|uniref:Leucine rich repeat protein n=1 Tax=Eimeria tenella TaxID=5802 RepID=U6KR79_EIMTE|nr:hypothetical protein, conserved [Eimeria tenella]CDJ40456.1 hypothetical protein, conserved [Eimeria tenella]|eukprot:XP_013231206.1 hypothetical protein, conserved [Eimeria tenella]